jgi:hypothetical protein
LADDEIGRLEIVVAHYEVAARSRLLWLHGSERFNATSRTPIPVRTFAGKPRTADGSAALAGSEPLIGIEYSIK